MKVDDVRMTFPIADLTALPAEIQKLDATEVEKFVCSETVVRQEMAKGNPNSSLKASSDGPLRWLAAFLDASPA